MISMLRELLTFLGAHFYLALIGCGELVLAVILLTALSERRNGARRRVPVTVPGSGPEQLMLRELAELAEQEDEACLLLRRSDLLPLYAAGDLTAVLGVSIDTLRNDLAAVLMQLQTPGGGPPLLKAILKLGRWGGHFRRPSASKWAVGPGEGPPLRGQRI
ncbi:MAG: hypothetical protein V8R27_00275 [Oscillospiraceae bacterium]